METDKTYSFDIILAPDDNPDSYAPGYPYVRSVGRTEEEARRDAEEFFLEPGEHLGDLRKEN